MSKSLKLFVALMSFPLAAYSNYCAEYSVNLTVGDSNTFVFSQVLIGEDFISTVMFNQRVVLRKGSVLATLSPKRDFIFVCPLGNGLISYPLFEIVHLKSGSRTALNLGVKFIDEVSCFISKDGRYLLVKDDFLRPERSFLFDINGNLLDKIGGRYSNPLKYKKSIIDFPDVLVFGGGKACNKDGNIILDKMIVSPDSCLKSLRNLAGICDETE